MMGPYWHAGAGGGWMALAWLMMLAFWGLVVIGVAVAIRWAMAFGAVGQSRESPIEILRRRYAVGELTREQFESMKRDVA